ncbi:MAG: zf-TFIIB domain-containing protein [Haloarculaceae archaeon]
MTSEFDLPCADCGVQLVHQEVSRAGDTVTIAQCPDCGGRYYPEAALRRL